MPHVPRGLSNFGNTCYMNASLQGLLSSARFRSLLLRSRERIRQNEQPNNILDAFRGLMQKLYFDKYKRSAVPYFFYRNIHRISPNMNAYDQQDAQEFIVCALERLEETMKKKLRLNEGKNPIERIFDGTQTSVIKCSHCGHISVSESPFRCFGLNLDHSPKIQNIQKPVLNMQRCLDNTLAKQDFLEGRTCPHCKRNDCSSRKSYIKAAPEVLIVYLERMYYNMRGKTFKNNTNVAPSLILHLPITEIVEEAKVEQKLNSPKNRNKSVNSNGTASSSDSPGLNNVKINEKFRTEKYRLTSLICHAGSSLFSGHYYSHVRIAGLANAGKQQWAECDDDYVTPESEKLLKQENSVYVAVYERIREIGTSLDNIDISYESMDNVSDEEKIVVEEMVSSSSQTPSRRKAIPSLQNTPKTTPEITKNTINSSSAGTGAATTTTVSNNIHHSPNSSNSGSPRTPTTATPNIRSPRTPTILSPRGQEKLFKTMQRQGRTIRYARMQSFIDRRISQNITRRIRGQKSLFKARFRRK